MFQEPEVVEMGLAEELVKIDLGKEEENLGVPQPTFDPVSVYLPEEE